MTHKVALLIALEHRVSAAGVATPQPRSEVSQGAIRTVLEVACPECNVLIRLVEWKVQRQTDMCDI